MNSLKLRKKLAVAVVIVCLAIINACIFAASPVASGSRRFTDDGSKLFGNWTGESICVGDNPNCHDEKVIYRISKSASGEAGKVTIAADKIVDGKPELMGVLDFKYDAEKGTLVGEFQTARYHGVWEYTVKGNVMEGTLTLLPAKTIARRVKVRKDE
jgi:hypothetical protein